MVADKIERTRFRYIEKSRAKRRNILQVSSEIRGRLPKEYLSQLGDILLKILPAGSVSGAPKKSTLDIIKRAEGTPRGYYSGVFGYFDGEELDSAVMIRFIEEDGHDKFFRRGGGITASSDPRSEYN